MPPPKRSSRSPLVPRNGPPNLGNLDPSAVATRIKAERERLGLTIADAAFKLGIDSSNYRNLEFRANPQLSRLLTLKRLGFNLRAIVPELFEEYPA